MIEPRDRVRHGLHSLGVGKRWPFRHDHAKAKRPCCYDLAIGSGPAAVPADNHIDSVRFHEGAIGGLVEWAARDDISGMGKRRRRLNRIDAPHQIEMLRRPLESTDSLAPECKKDAPRRFAERPDSLIHGVDFNPIIARDRGPGWPPKGEQRGSSRARGVDRAPRNDDCVGVGRIDQRVDPLVPEIGGKPGRAAKATDTCRSLLVDDIRGPASERDGDGEVWPATHALSELPSLCRSAEDENAYHGAS